MRLLRHKQTGATNSADAFPRQGRITVAELAQSGLDRHPSAVGIYWPDSQRVVCRKHATSPVAVKTFAAIREPGDTAVLLVAGDDAARALRRQCLSCPS